MIHDNERRAFLRGAEAMRAAAGDALEKAARETSAVGKDARMETDRLILKVEANALMEHSRAVRAMPLPVYDGKG